MTAVLGDTRYVVISYGAGDAYIIMVEGTCPFIQSVHTLCEGAYPKVITGIVVYAHHPVVRKAGRIFWIVSVVDEFLAVKAIQPSKVGSYPQVIIPVHLQADDDVVGQAVGLCGIVPELAECACRPVKMDQASSIRCDPDVPFFVFGKSADVVERQAGAIPGLASVLGELEPLLMVVADGALECAYPDGAGIISVDCADAVVGKTFAIVLHVGDGLYGKISFVYDVHTSVVGGHPDVAAGILDNVLDHVAAQPGGAGVLCEVFQLPCEG